MVVVSEPSAAITQFSNSPLIARVQPDSPLLAATINEVQNAPAGSQNTHEDRMQPARFEYKYIISEPKALKIRDLITPTYLLPDEHTPPPGRITDAIVKRGYLVHSLYLDSADLYTYERKEQGDRNRFKLRIRFYDNDPNSPCYFEVKLRRGDRILKTRAAVTKAAAERYCREGIWAFPREEDLIKRTRKNIEGLSNFRMYADAINARPAVIVSYWREAYENEGDNRSELHSTVM